ncbi:MAG TPA: hypothetical protein PLA83_01995 [Deltaproteobacteria bacterium]|jgi:hypothetical protein|nr:hypothetical protein [Deltaproteobacteria bacterium]HQI00039.1 hypothetical protein [Deltaproteobacteria bacterium]
MLWCASLDPTKTLLIIQFVVQAILLGVIIFFVVADRKKGISPSALDDLKELIGQTRQLSDNFSNQIKTEVEIVKGAMTELDDKIREAKLLMEGLEKASVNVKEVRKYTPSDVAKLHKGGFDPVDISRITGIPVGEIQLMVKMYPEGH